MHADNHPVPIDRFLNPFRDFAANKLAGAGLLLAATAVALVWANSPLAASYHALFDMPVAVSAGPLEIKKPLLHWINDGLMGFFFFVVGLEISVSCSRGTSVPHAWRPSPSPAPSAACSSPRSSTSR